MRTVRCEQSSGERQLLKSQQKRRPKRGTERGKLESYERPAELGKSTNSDLCSKRARMMTWTWLKVTCTLVYYKTFQQAMQRLPQDQGCMRDPLKHAYKHSPLEQFHVYFSNGTRHYF